MNKHDKLLDALTTENYLYGKNRRQGLSYILERNTPARTTQIGESTKEYRLSIICDRGMVAETCCFDAHEAPTALLPLRYVVMNELRKYWT